MAGVFAFAFLGPKDKIDSVTGHLKLM